MVSEISRHGQGFNKTHLATVGPLAAPNTNNLILRLRCSISLAESDRRERQAHNPRTGNHCEVANQGTNDRHVGFTQCRACCGKMAGSTCVAFGPTSASHDRTIRGCPDPKRGNGDSTNGCRNLSTPQTPAQIHTPARPTDLLNYVAEACPR